MTTTTLPATSNRLSSWFKQDPLRLPAPYRLICKLGRGGMGEVYLAEHSLLRRRCAIKVIRADKSEEPSAVARFRAEIRAARSIRHPRVVRVLDAGQTADQRDFFVLEYVRGRNLEQTVERRGPLSPHRVIELLRQMGSAVSAVHAQGLVHCDIKPANIMAGEDRRGGLSAKLLDFGLAAPLGTGATSSSDTTFAGFVGSPLYAPPESAVGQRDARSDIYSLGATAYHLLVGRPVFDVPDPVRALYAHAWQDPVSAMEVRLDVSPALDEIIMTCLKKNPDERFQSMTELTDAVAEARL